MSRLPRIKYATFKCIGGPFDKGKIRLSVECPQSICSNYFGIESFNNGEVGRYESNGEQVGTVIWNKK